jgi:hypothetical protein
MIVIYLCFAALSFLLGLTEHALWLGSAIGIGLAVSWVPQWRRARERESKRP